MKTPLGESVGGTRLIEQLPHPNTKRWVVRRKAAVVAAVRSGGVTLEEACRVYQLSKEELLSWDRAFELHGLAGLRVTRIQQYRRSPPEDLPSASQKQPVETLPTAARRNSSPPPDGAHFREIAHGLRILARCCRYPGARTELLQLAAGFERRADHLDDRQSPPGDLDPSAG
jgi:transposase-like protein